MVRRGLLCLAALGMVACGGSSTNTPTVPSNPFVGNWTLQGMPKVLCNGMPVSFNLGGGSASFAAGSGSALTGSVTEAGGTCTVQMTVDGTTATATPNQSCMVSVAGAQGTIKVDAFSLTTADGMTGTFNESLTVMLTLGGQPYNCTAMASGAATRAAPGDGG